MAPLDRPTFHPRSVPTLARRVVFGIGGPLLWLIALVVAAAVNRRGDEIELALAITALSALLVTILILPGAISRRRRIDRGE